MRFSILIGQWLSKFGVHHNHKTWVWKCRIQGIPLPKFSLSRPPESDFSTSFLQDSDVGHLWTTFWEIVLCSFLNLSIIWRLKRLTFSLLLVKQGSHIDSVFHLYSVIPRVNLFIGIGTSFVSRGGRYLPSFLKLINHLFFKEIFLFQCSWISQFFLLQLLLSLPPPIGNHLEPWNKIKQNKNIYTLRCLTKSSSDSTMPKKMSILSQYQLVK